MSLVKTLPILLLSVFVLFQSSHSNARTQPTYHITVLVDVSGSMKVETSTGDERRITLAIDLVASRLIHDLALLDTFYYQVLTWSESLYVPPIFSGDVHTEESAFISESEIYRQQFIIRNDTFTGRALKQFLELYTELDCSRHVLLIVTDNPPDDPGRLSHSISEAQDAGFSVGVMLIDSASINKTLRYYTSIKQLPHTVVKRELDTVALENFLGEVLSESVLPTYCFTG